ncbi:MAG: sugar kinase [Planctomycetota bacterium]|nr:MAG: sugar kinase [Planctomycetota bacterium]
MSDSAVLAFDVGGTHVRGARVGRAGEVFERARRGTPQDDGAALIATLASLCSELDPTSTCSAVGVAMAGVLDRHAGCVRHSPSLGISDLPLVQELSAASGRGVVLINDVNAAALGEAQALGESELAAIFVGTGVGTGFVCGGRLVEGQRGMAGEGGHVVHRWSGRPGTAGVDGCFESYLGGRALGQRAAELGLGDTAHDLLAAWRRGAPEAQEAVQEALQAMGAITELIVTLFDPARIVVGGGVAAGFPELIDAARQAIARHPLGDGRRDLPVQAAQTGDLAGLLGAAARAHDPQL